MLKFISIPSFLILCFFITSCGTEVEKIAIDNSQKDVRPKIALIMKSLANEFFVTMEEGALAHQKANADKYDLITNGIKNETDLAQQVRLIDQMISVGVDAIVIAPADSKAIVPALSRVKDAGIVIVNIDNRLDENILLQYGLSVPFVGPNNFKGAQVVGEYLATKLNKGAQVAIIEGVQTAYNSQRRVAGFKKAMDLGEMEVVAQQSADWDQTKAVNITSAILIQYPEIEAILCANDSMALGAVAAVKQAGLSERIKIVGFDNISAAKELIALGDLTATADQHGDLLAVYGIEYAIELLDSEGGLPDKSTTVDLITKETQGMQ